MDKKAAAKRTAEKVSATELALAEERGERRVREQVRLAIEEGRRVVRVGGQQVEVVEVSALADLLPGAEE